MPNDPKPDRVQHLRMRYAERKIKEAQQQLPGMERAFCTGPGSWPTCSTKELEPFNLRPWSIAVSLNLTKQFGVLIKVATGPHERVAGLHDDSVLAMSPFLQFADEIDANQ